MRLHGGRIKDSWVTGHQVAVARVRKKQLSGLGRLPQVQRPAVVPTCNKKNGSADGSAEMQREMVCLKEAGDIIAVRRVCREMSRRLGFGSADQTRLAAAISEVARNAIQYAGEGTCIIRDDSNEQENIIRVIVEDHGPGFEDIDKALEPVFSTNDGLGAGLPGAKRLVHTLQVQSEPGHTVVTLAMKRRRSGR